MPCVLTAHDSRSVCPAMLGAQLAEVLRLPLVAATSYRPESLFVSRRMRPRTATERREREARLALSAVREVVPANLPLRLEAVPAADAAQGLLDLAFDVDAALVVVGEDLDGDVAREVLRRSPQPVAVAPRDPGLLPAVIATVGVAYDGSPGAREALRFAARLARRADARLRLVAAEHRDPLDVLTHPTDPDAELRLAATALGEGVDHRLVSGPPATALRDALDDVDVAVCGAHGRPTLAGALLGSVASRLSQDVERPLVVVPHAPEV